jgi:hypothetical protein
MDGGRLLVEQGNTISIPGQTISSAYLAILKLYGTLFKTKATKILVQKYLVL